MNLFIINIIISVFILVLIIFNIIILIKMLKYRGEVFRHTHEVTLDRARMSMIEYTFRKYKEGQNPFTTLRDISNILKYLNL